MNKENIIRKKIFIRFLKENNSFKSYLNNFNIVCFYNDIDDVVKDEIRFGTNNEISSVFSWVTSKEGFNYWEKLDRKWRQLIKEKKYLLDS